MRTAHKALTAIGAVALLAAAAATAWHFAHAPAATRAPSRALTHDAGGWVTLGRSYAAAGRFEEAAAAYAQAAALRPKDAQVLADYADARAMTQGRRLQGAPEPLIARALELDPKNVKALSLSGSLLYEKGDYAGAARQWRRLLPLVPADSEFARLARARIQAAERRAGGAPP